MDLVMMIQVTLRFLRFWLFPASGLPRLRHHEVRSGEW
jgi:hypothetical protein